MDLPNLFLKYDEEVVHIFSDSTVKLVDILMNRYENAVNLGVCRYKPDVAEQRFLEQKYMFITRLSIDRAIKRRAPICFKQLKEPFNPDNFNFNKVKDSEILFEIELYCCTLKQDASHLMLINVSPFAEYSVLLVPNLHQCLPQLMTSDGLRLALEVSLAGDLDMRIGFNSLGAFASVNHYHFHVFPLKYKMYLEDCLIESLYGPVFEVKNYPAQGFVFLLEKDSIIEEVVINVMKLLDKFHENGIAYNLMITHGQGFHITSSPEENIRNAIRIFIWARNFFDDVKSEVQFNPAVCELFGYVPIYSKSYFLSVTEEEIASTLHNACKEEYIKVCKIIPNIYDSNL